MTEGSPWKHILVFAIPVFLGSLLQQLYNTVDTIILGNFSSQEALAAVGTTNFVVFFFLAMAIGLSSGCGVVVAQSYGARDYNNVRRNAGCGVSFLMIVGIVTSVFGIIFSRFIFNKLLIVPEELIEQTLLYFRIYCIGLIFQFGYNIYSSILRALGDSRATLYFLLVSSLMNVVLDLLFIASFNWSVFGAAFATVISQACSLIAAHIYMVKKYPIFRFKKDDYKLRKEPILKTIKIGLPISINLMIVSIGLSFVQRVVNEFGKDMTASFTVGSRIEQYMNLPFTSLQTTLATYTGQNVGANKIDRVKKGSVQAIIISLCFTLVISFIIYNNAESIALLFNLSDQSLKYCIMHIKAVSLANIMLGMYVPIHGTLQGTGHSFYPVIVASSVITLRVIIIYTLRYSSFLGYTIIWWNGLFGFILGFILTWGLYLSGKWQKVRR